MQRPWAALIQTLRPPQWAKNLLIFFPLLTAHRLADRIAVTAAFLAFVAFCAAASAGYVINDVIDLASDRSHRSKRRRPFASGALPLSWRYWLVPALLMVSAALTVRLPRAFQLLLAGYLALTIVYSVWLKRIALVDVLVLAGLYTMRLFGGSLVADVALSNWFLAFSMFLFLSLALAKRVSELKGAADAQQTPAPGREYRTSDLAVLGRMGLSAGQLSVLVLALYINSSDVLRFYRSPELLWLLCGLLFLWISRVWLVVERGELHDDPVVFVLLDRAGYAIAALAAMVLYWAT